MRSYLRPGVWGVERVLLQHTDTANLGNGLGASSGRWELHFWGIRGPFVYPSHHIASSRTDPAPSLHTQMRGSCALLPLLTAPPPSLPPFLPPHTHIHTHTGASCLLNSPLPPPSFHPYTPGFSALPLARPTRSPESWPSWPSGRPARPRGWPLSGGERRSRRPSSPPSSLPAARVRQQQRRWTPTRECVKGQGRRRQRGQDRGRGGAGWGH